MFGFKSKNKNTFPTALFVFPMFIKWCTPLNFTTVSFLRQADLKGTFSQITNGREKFCEENFKIVYIKAPGRA